MDGPRVNRNVLQQTTKTNWDGAGVEPDVRVPAADSLARAEVGSREQSLSLRTSALRRQIIRQNGGGAFRPFEQQHKNREGLGLGLAVAHRAIALNDGTIDVKNLPGSGCIFRISLPSIKRKGRRYPHMSPVTAGATTCENLPD